MRFWDIFSLATDTKEIGSLQRRPDAKAIYSSFLAQSRGSAPPIAGRFWGYTLDGFDNDWLPKRDHRWPDELKALRTYHAGIFCEPAVNR
jgi:hypothetical protein